MALFESQIEVRQRLDDELLENAYASLAMSIGGNRNNPAFHVDDLKRIDGAARACLRYCGVRRGNVPDDISDLNERIEWLCRPSGTMHRMVRLDGTWYQDAFGAMLGYLDTGEPIALLPDAIGGYYYHDPTTGRKVRVTKKVVPHIAPEATFFYRPLPQGKLHILDLLRFLVAVFDRSDYVFVFMAALAATLVGVLPAMANQIAFKTVIPSGQSDLIAPIGALLVGVALSNTLINVCRNIVMARVTTKLRIATEAATFSRVLLLPTSFFKDYESGDLASRVSQVTVLMQLLTSLLLGSGLTAFLSLVYIGQIGFYAPALVTPALIVTILQALLTILVAVISSRRQQKAMESSSKLSGLVTALLNGISKLKLAGAEDRAFFKWAEEYSTYAREMYNQPFVERALPAIITAISMAGTIVIYYRAGRAHLSVANYMSFSAAYGMISGAITSISSMAGQVARIRPLLEMVSPILEASPETAEDKPSVERLTGGIEVSNVWFKYAEGASYVLRNLSFKIRPGEYVAIVGKSGCGKSTALRCLLGFEKPERGTVLYGPYDVTKVDLRSLRRSIGTVMQDGKLFLGDIFSNITVSAPTATLDDAWKAAEIAGIADDIRRMPMGMQTLLTEGSGGISGGQRQRIMIARAICGNRRILMFDEATSALDNVTQRHVADALAELNCTRIVVAHRLSTVRHCDRILVMNNGCIEEEGTYEELIAKDGLFADLVARQRLE